VISNQTTPPQTRLRNRIFAASAWNLVSFGAGFFVRILSNLILTRLLFPEAFGAIAAATALIVGLALISDFGVRAVIVQSPRGGQDSFLRSAWVFQLWRGVAVWIVLAALCALISASPIRDLLPTASVFADRTLPLVTASLGLIVVFGGAESTAVSLQVRHINYKQLVWLELISKILSLPIIIIWAWLAPSVWALVAGIVASSFIRMVLTHVWVPGPRMSLNWEKDHFQEIVRFGRWIVVSSFATFIGAQCDVILLGILVPGSVLGLYSIAKMLAGTGEGIVDSLTGTLALPIFGEVIRKDPGNLRNRYYRFRLPIDLTAGILSGGLFAAGSFIVSFLYDARYEQAGFMLQVLALGTASYPFSIIANAFTATGNTHLSALASVVKAVSLIACMVLGYFSFGTLGAIGGVAFHRVIPSVVIMFLAHQRNWIGIWPELRIIPSFVVGVLIGKGCVLIANALGIHNIHQFIHF
jgi:O-antigen/teichoic acid export membrane protein